MIVRVVGGLANRLRAMLSRWHTAEGFVWEPTAEICFGRFIDAFEPIEKPIWSAHDSDLTTCDPDWSAGGNYDAPGWAPLYRKLVPRSRVQCRIDALRGQLGEYIAMHVRRTDHVEYAKKEGAFTDDEAFLRFAESSRLPCFLATDNGCTQRKMRDWLGERLVTSGEIDSDEEVRPGGDGRRFTTLEDAVVDLYVCVGAKAFLGSGASSFTKAIEYMRAAR